VIAVGTRVPSKTTGDVRLDEIGIRLFHVRRASRRGLGVHKPTRADHSLLLKTVDGGNLACGLALIRRMSVQRGA
jgi:hypothetical protein